MNPRWLSKRRYSNLVKIRPFSSGKISAGGNKKLLFPFEKSVVLQEQLAKTCCFGLGALTLAALTGWFAATDTLARSVALHLSLWLGLSTILATILCTAAQLFLSATGKGSHYISTLGTTIVLYLSYGTFVTGLSAWSSLSTLTGIYFSPDLEPSSYAEAAKRSVDAAGAPFTILMPWAVDRARFPDLSFLSHWTGDRHACREFSVWQREQFDGETVSGQPLPTGGVTMLVVPDTGELPVEVTLFGLRTDGNDDALRKAASHISGVVDRISSGAPRHVTCTKPKFSNGKWMCFAGHGKENRYDLAFSLLQRGAAFVDHNALIGSPMRLDFLRAQAHGQANGCGIWAR